MVDVYTKFNVIDMPSGSRMVVFSLHKRNVSFREQVIVDTGSELPICFVVTPANIDEKKVMEQMLNQMEEKHLRKAYYLMLDRGYDSKHMLEVIRKKRIKPIIDNRIMRKGDKTIQYKDTEIYYTESGNCYYLDYGNNEVEAERINEKTGLPNYFKIMNDIDAREGVVTANTVAVKLFL